MRTLSGIIITIVVLTGAILTILALWGIQPISWVIVWKSGATIGIISVTAVLIYLVNFLFFKNFKKNKN